MGLIGSRALTVRVQGDESIRARGDPKRLRQILTNLVGNAVKFTERGEVVVEIGRERRLAIISVRDTGPGIAPQELAAIFQEYKQTKAERSRRRGTGLGLAITRRLVTMHGGAIHVHSAVGGGSVFEVQIPLWRETRAASVRAELRDKS
jgi:signal transduction histidine kinase